MIDALMRWSGKVRQAYEEPEVVTYGPWLGANAALPDDRVPKEYVPDGRNAIYVPASENPMHGYWRRRGGQAIKFEPSVAGAVGLLPAKFSSRVRHFSEFKSDSIIGGVPTLGALCTKETVVTGLDDGRFGTYWVRNQVDDVNYTVGSEYDATAYPIPGTALNPYKIVPLWYESGEGGITRGTTEFNRRFFFPGSRRPLETEKEIFFPSRYGTPSRWRKMFETATGTSTTNINRLMPTGPIMPTHSGTVSAGTADANGGFRGYHRFAYSCAYRDENGNIWAPCPVRLPNSNLPDGFGICTVDSANPANRYRSVVFTNLPVPPHGLTLVIMRGPMVDSTGANALNIDPYDLRPIAEIRDKTITRYEHFISDDSALMAKELAETFVNHELAMQPRSRYMFGGDTRACCGYGAENPCAIVIAPLSHTVAGDLNKPDNDAAFTIYGTGAVNGYAASYMWLQNESGLNNTTLKLVQYDTEGDVMATKDFTLSSYATIQDLVDAINATSLAVDGQEWRAQVCPGAEASASPATALLPHTRQFSGEGSLTLNDATLTCAGGGMLQIAVGTKIRVSGTPAMDGYYVTSITSDTEVELSQVSTVTNAAATIDFFFDLGDNPTAGTTNFGYQRCIANSLPAFLFYTKSQLDKGTIDNAGIWMTTSNPGQNKSFLNGWTLNSDCKHNAPTDPGIFLGGGAVDNGFVLFWTKKRGAIRNTKDSGTGRDADYKLFITNENSGGISWNTIVPGNRFVGGMAPEGYVCADLYDENLISEALWVRSQNESETVDAESLRVVMAADAAASRGDTDAARMWARIARGVIYLGYTLVAGNHPTRYVAYDFSAGSDSGGLASLFRAPGLPWGWSVRQHQSFALICEGHRSDGSHLYAWNEQNLGSGGDGRIDEFETGDTDNGTAISAYLSMPWERGRSTDQVSAQELRVEHLTASTATVSLSLFRGFENQTEFAMTLVGDDNVPVIRTRKMLTTGARVMIDAVFLRWVQSAGPAAQLRKIELLLHRVRSAK